MTVRARALLWGVLAIGIAIACAVLFSGPSRLQTNLLAVLPPTEQNPLAEIAVNKLADAAGNRAIFLIGQTSTETPDYAARQFADQLRNTNAFKQVVSDIPPVNPKQLTDVYVQHRYHLLSDADRADLAEGKIQLDDRVLRKLHTPFRFGLTLSPAEDPFGFTDAWLASLPLHHLKLQPENGLLVTRHAGKAWVLVSAELKASAYDNDVQRDVRHAVKQAETALKQTHPHIELLRTGTVFYADAARTSAEREVDIFGIASLIGILLMLYLVFRSVQPLALGLLSVGFGIGAAVTVTLLVFGEIHLITLVFGASLIGEAIDYAIQYFAAHLGAGPNWSPIDNLRRITPGLLLALATSLLGYAALLLAPFPVLSQIALFALTGLSAAWLSVFLLLPALLTRPNKRHPDEAAALPRRLLAWWQTHVSRRICYGIAAVVVVIGAPGWLLLNSNDDVRLLIARPPALMAQENTIRELIGFSNSNQFFLVEGATPDDVLAKEEALRIRLSALTKQGAITGYHSISSFVPSAAQQTANRALWQHHVFSDEKKLAALLARVGLQDNIASEQITAFKQSTGQHLKLDDWLTSPTATPFRHLWLGQTTNRFASIVLPQGVRDVDALHAAANGFADITFVDKAGSVTRLFQEYRRWGGLWLLGALCIVFAVLCVRYRLRRAAIVITPTLLAMTLTLGLLGYLHIPLTLFNIMGLMLVLGVGVNYSIFLQEGGISAPATFAGVLLSAATTLLSFGLLAFSSMPALSSFGLTLLIGIGFTALLAPMVLSFASETAT